MNTVLIDTSVVIDFLRRTDKENALFFKLVKRNYNLTVSIVTHSELYAGKSVWGNDQAYEELEKLFQGITIVPLEETISKNAGRLKAYYSIDLFDSIIAATAIQQHSLLVTLNRKDFESIKGLQLFTNDK